MAAQGACRQCLTSPEWWLLISWLRNPPQVLSKEWDSVRMQLQLMRIDADAVRLFRTQFRQ